MKEFLLLTPPPPQKIFALDFTDSEEFQTQATVLLVDMTAVVLILSSGTVFIVCASVCEMAGVYPPPFLKGSASLIESGSSLRAGRGDLAAQLVIIAAAGQIN